MIVHLVKLCVGMDSIDQLETLQANRRARAQKRGEPLETIHRTRHRPRRDRELLNGGSLYWIIKGFIRVRQAIVRLDELHDDDEGKHCGLVLGQDLVRTELRARRPHQGWRYLEPKDAPPDLPPELQNRLSDPNNCNGPPPEMAAELQELGLL